MSRTNHGPRREARALQTMLFAIMASQLTACANGGDDQQDTLTNASSRAPEVITSLAARDHETALSIMENASAEAGEFSLSALTSEGFSDALFDGASVPVHEKVRNGALYSFNELVGNATVHGLANGESCTMQVINQHFVLTAAHCIPYLFPSGASTLELRMNDAGGNPVLVYSGAATAAQYPGWGPAYNDVALILLWGAFQTCEGKFAQCGTAQVRPSHAAFQYFHPDYPIAWQSSYDIMGYGSTDEVGPRGIGRRGTMARQDSAFFVDGTGFATTMQWTSASQSRPCGGDSGSPLLFKLPGQTRPLHTGILSGGPPRCTVDTGGVRYYGGLSFAQAQWVMNAMMGIKSVFNLPFRCGASMVTNQAVATAYFFFCENDGIAQ